MEIKKLLKNRNNRLMLVILIIGIAITAISGSTSLFKSKDEPEQAEINVKGEEEKLGEILSQISGAGKVSVMITYESTAEKELAEAEGNAVTSSGEVVVKREVYPKVRGVIVIADGADNSELRRDIKEAVMTVTGAAANRVCVYCKNAESEGL